MSFYVFCENMYSAPWENTCVNDPPGGSLALFGTDGFPPAQYGDWVVRAWLEDEGGTVIAGPVSLPT